MSGPPCLRVLSLAPESLHSSLGQFKGSGGMVTHESNGARELSPTQVLLDLHPMSNIGCLRPLVAGFCFRGKGRKGRLNGPRTAAGMNGFDPNSARFRLFQLRRPLQGKTA